MKTRLKSLWPRARCGLLALAATTATGCAAEDELPTTAASDAVLTVTEVAPISPVGENASTEPQNYAVVGNRAFALATPNRLYRTDGTTEGTVLVSRMISSFDTVPRLVPVKDRVYWATGSLIWTSDGTGAGTEPFLSLRAPGDTLFALNGALYLGDQGLYRSDDTGLLTRVSSLTPSAPPLVVGGLAYYPCVTALGYQLCVTDGTGPGTRVLGTTRTDTGDKPIILGEISGSLLISGRFSQARRSLWGLRVFDGAFTELLTAGAQDVIAAGAQPPATLGGFAYFPCVTAAGNELCRSDGTVAGTSVLDLAAAGSSDPAVVALPDRLLIRARLPATGTELYVSNGTVAGTSLLTELVAGAGDGVSRTRLLRVGTTVYFGATAAAGGSDLARTDGTAAGTVVLRKDTALTLRSSLGQDDLDNAIALNDRLLFTASQPSTRYEPWISDGTVAGTRLIKDLTGQVGRTSFERVMRPGANGGYCLLTTRDPDNRTVSIFATDGTAARTSQLGTELSAPVATNSALFYSERTGSTLTLRRTNCIDPPITAIPSSPRFFEGTALGNRLVLLGTGNSTYPIPWFSDGTPSGTKASSIDGALLVVTVKDKIWMAAGPLGEQLWVSDGTAAGSRLVKDLHVGPNPATMGAFTPLADQTLFVASDGATGRELWRTDGTAAGTAMVTELVPGPAGSEPLGLVPWKNEVMFRATDAAGVRALWRSDGTAAGTVRIKEVAPRLPLVVWGDYVFFSVDGALGDELWRSDGTAAGTVQVADLFEGVQSSKPDGLFLKSPQGPLFFAAETPAVGRELWMLTDPLGEPELALDLAPGGEWSSPRPLFVKDGALYLYAETNDRGKLWKTPDEPAPPAPPTPPATPEDPADGCACAAGASGASALAPGALVLLGLLRRRRRRR